MSDEDVLGKISTLVDEENSLREHETGHDAQRLAHIEETLDQCWDLLRQRRALREFGRNPDVATVRGVDIVENYLQ